MYYWLRLKTDFFKSKEMKKLRKIAGGDTYTIIYLKLQLLSLTDDGFLYFDGIEDSFAEELALMIDEEPENVQATLLFLQKCGLLELKSEHEMLLSEVPSLIGKETDKAALMRRKRERDKLIQANTAQDKLTQADITQDETIWANMTQNEKMNGNNVTAALPNRYTDIDIEREKEKESKSKNNNNSVQNASASKAIEESFARFWSAYPKKQGKQDAFKAFKKASAKVNEEVMLESLEAWKASEQWKKEKGKYIPMASTWLNGERWNDELEISNMETYSGQSNHYDMYREMDTWREL